MRRNLPDRGVYKERDKLMTAVQKLNHCYDSVKAKIGDFVPHIALVLGSGLGAFADEIDIVCTVDYADIDGFPKSTVEGHKGRFVCGKVGGVDVIIMQGRVHFYEGYSMDDTVLPIRLMRKLGVQVLLLTNAAGGISFGAGEFMLITDQISTFVPSPLIGANMSEFGVRFPDMSEIYDSDLRDIIAKAAASVGVDLKQGIYVQTSGPNFESPAEIKMFKTLGADAVGMSTACEALAANHAGMRICGISCIANLACGLSENPLTHDEVMEATTAAAPLFKKLIRAAIEGIGNG